MSADSSIIPCLYRLLLLGIFRDGAEVLEGWGAFALLGWFAASLTPSELKFYVGISWVAGLVLTLVLHFSGTPGQP